MHQSVYKNNLNFKVIAKNVLEPDDSFERISLALMG